MFCNKCGTKLEDDAGFCSMCGCGIEQHQEKTNSVSKGEQSGTSKFSKIIITVLSAILLISVTLNVVQIALPNGASGESQTAGSEQAEQGEYDKLVESAIESLKIKWIGLYEDSEGANGYLEIFHTRVIDITPNESDTVFQEMDRGMEIDYIVEFSLYSDYFSTAPYYHNATTYDTVIVYKDGTTSVANNFFRIYSSLTYSYDYSSFLEDIEDLGTTYNQIINLNYLNP